MGDDISDSQNAPSGKGAAWLRNSRRTVRLTCSFRISGGLHICRWRG